MVRTRLPFNKYPSLKLLTPSYTFLPDVIITGCKNHIDRIQLSISSKMGSYGYLRTILERDFIRISVKADKITNTRKIRCYQFPGSHLQLISYGSDKNYYLSVILQDPNPESQSLLRDILMTLPHSEIYLHQIEFAWDFYVENKIQAKSLKWSIDHNIVLKYSQVDCYSRSQCDSQIQNFFSKERTCYQGNKGNVRNGAKGLRLYIKSDGTGSFVRVELQANSKWIKDKLKLNIGNLPINHTHLDFSECFVFRKGLTTETIQKLTNRIFKNNRKESLLPMTDLARKARKAAERNLIVRQITNDGAAACYEEYELPPVCKQISGFKKVKNKYGFSNQVNQYFPEYPKTF